MDENDEKKKELREHSQEDHSHEQQKNHEHHEHHEQHDKTAEHNTHKSHDSEVNEKHGENKAVSAIEKKAAKKKKRSKKSAKRSAQAKHEIEKEEGKSKKSYLPYVIIGILAVIVIIALIVRFTSGSQPTKVENAKQYGSADVTFYVMSQCPYGVQVENAIKHVIDEMNENIDFRLEFIGSESNGNFNSLHGQPEVEGNIIQLCVQDMYPKDLVDFVYCQNKNVQDLKGSVEKCSKDVGIDAAKITACASGSKGKALLSESFKKSDDAGAQGSPTIYINGVLYSGERDAASFKRVICKDLKSHPLCENLPACGSDSDCKDTPGKIGVCKNPGKKDAKCEYTDDEPLVMYVLNAKECASCDSTQLVMLLSQVFLNMEVEDVDASSSKGKELIKTAKLTMAPSYVIEGSLDKTYAWKNNPRIQGAFRKVGSYYALIDDASGANYLLDAKARKEREALIGVTKGDNMPQIDFYVMSYCPYGNIAEEAIEPVYRLLNDLAEFNPHYVIYSNYQGGGKNFCIDDESKYCSMHGVQEMTQGLRELCVDKYMGIDAYFRFVLEMNKKCNYANADSCWEAVAKSLKLDTEKIKNCEKYEFEEILSKELALNKALGVSGSPTVFVEGEAYGGARSAAGFAAALCAGFDTAPKECDKESLTKLGSSTPPVSAAASAGSC